MRLVKLLTVKMLWLKTRLALANRWKNLDLLTQKVYCNKPFVEGDVVDQYRLFDAEHKFVSLIWENEPVNSTELVRLCNEKLGWKKSKNTRVKH